MSSRPDPQIIAIASDHAGFDMKAALIDWLRTQGHDIRDLGPGDTMSVDYPDFGFKLAEAIASGSAGNKNVWNLGLDSCHWIVLPAPLMAAHGRSVDQNKLAPFVADP